MKEIFLIIILFSVTSVYGQNKKIASNELSINPILIVTFLNPIITYERILNEDNSIGINLGVSLEDDEIAVENKRWNNSFDKYTVRPFYRYYFNNKIFIEPHLNLDRGYFIEETSLENNKEALNKFGIGLACGIKKITSRQYIFQVKIGMIKDFLNPEYYESLHENTNNQLPKGTDTFGRISIGKRF